MLVIAIHFLHSYIFFYLFFEGHILVMQTWKQKNNSKFFPVVAFNFHILAFRLERAKAFFSCACWIDFFSCFVYDFL